jgi:predicted amidohydrolase
MAQRYQVTILGAVIPCPLANGGKVYNTALLVDKYGNEAAWYEKFICLMWTPDGTPYLELRTVVPGSEFPAT